MATATNSTLGEIVLSGDFTGAAESPQLLNTGVIAGNYKLTSRAAIDSKGRLVSIGSLTTTEINTAIDVAYASSPSSFDIVDGRPVLKTPPASASVRGLVKTAGIVSPGLSSTTNFGVFKLGSGTTIVTNDSNMPTISNIGAFIIGDGTGLYAAGTLSFSSGRFCQLTSSTAYASSGVLKAYTSVSLDGTWPQSTGVSMVSGATECASGGASGNTGVIVTGNNAHYVSTDSGQTWAAISGIQINIVSPKVSWNGSVFCVIGYTYTGGGSNIIAQTSADGITWSASNTIATSTTFDPVLSLTAFGSSFAATISTTSIELFTGNGSSWTSRGTSTGTVVYGLSNGKILRHGPLGVLQSSSNSGVSWTYIYRSISNGGTDSDDYTKRLPYPRKWSNDGFCITAAGMFATDGTTVGTKLIPLPGLSNTEPSFSDSTKLYFMSPALASGAQSSTMFSVLKSELSITGLVTPRREGLGVDLGALIPSTGGTVTSGTVSPRTEQVISKSLVAGSSSFSANSGGVDIAAGNDSVVINTSAYSALARGNAAASSGTRVVQVFVGVNSEWFTSYTDDGSTWITSKISTPTGASPRLVGMEYLASASKFVMIGKQTSATESQNWTAYSTDGITWTFNSSPWTSTAYITSSLSLGFSGVIATGRSGTNLCSVRTTDGISWTLSTTALVPQTSMACTCMDNIAGHTAAMWTICAATSASATAVYYSTNGTTWTVVGNAVSGSGGEIYAASSDGPCMVLTSTGVVYTGRSTSSGSVAVNLIYLNGSAAVVGAGANGYVLTMNSDSATKPSTLLKDPSGDFFVTRGSSVQRYGTVAAIGSGNSTYPLALGSTYVYPAYGSNMPGRAGGASSPLEDTTIGTVLPHANINKSAVNGPTQELILRGTTEAAGSIHEISISSGGIVPISVSAASANNCLISGSVVMPKNSRVSITAIRTSDSKWLFFRG